jgi:hypothetical protein
MKVYQAHWLDSFDAAGLRFYVQFGDQVVVDGQPYVRVGTSLVPQDTRWRESRADALRDVAMQAEDLAVKLRLQAEHLRKTADVEAAK